MRKLLCLTIAMMLFVTAAPPAAAQLDPGIRVYEIFEAGVKVGEIYVPPHQDRDLYVEHWVLFPGYVYPSESNGTAARIAQSGIVARSVPEFFARPFPTGSRYVEVTAHESESLPCHEPPR